MTHSVKQLVEVAFGHVGLDDRYHVKTGVFEEAEVYHLREDYSKARKEWGRSNSVSFEQLVGMMVDGDLQLISRTIPGVVCSGTD